MSVSNVRDKRERLHTQHLTRSPHGRQREGGPHLPQLPELPAGGSAQAEAASPSGPSLGQPTGQCTGLTGPAQPHRGILESHLGSRVLHKTDH